MSGFRGSMVVLVAATAFALLGIGCGKKEGEKSKAEVREPAAQVKEAEAPVESGQEVGQAEAVAPAEEAAGESPRGELTGSGSFYVESLPQGAQIVINGRNAGVVTPHLFDEQDPGRYEVSVVRSGLTSNPERLEVEVIPGSADTLYFELQGEPLSSFSLIGRREKEVWPKWSPDGMWIAYEAYYENNRDIYLMRVTGGQPLRLTFDPKADFSPCWSPDGKQIVFASNRSGNVDLWVVDVPDGAPRQLTSSRYSEENPCWSPDGEWIAFESRSKIWKMPASGGEAVQVTEGAERHMYPAWSPDGAEIAFTAQFAGIRQIWAVNVKTGKIRKIVADKGWSYAPSWSPDGSALVFSRRGGPPDRNHDVWVVPAKGGQMTQLTLELAHDMYPAFSPDGKKLVWAKEADIWIMTGLPDWLFGG